ncbi:MAG: hypothetical protein ABGX44_04555 [Candidatus Poseidoniia archaeon]|jgi:hypothetical protein
MTQVIHPTNHAIERFEERILPLIPETNSKRPKDKQTIKQRLYRLINRAKISNEELKSKKVDVFFSPIGCEQASPIPITLVINPAKRILVTLYLNPNWICESINGSTIWSLIA